MADKSKEIKPIKPKRIRVNMALILAIHEALDNLEKKGIKVAYEKN